MKQAVWDAFCVRFDISGSSVPLFAVDSEGAVQVRKIGKNAKLNLTRSRECEEMVLTATDGLVEDWNSDARRLDGMLYMMGWKRSQTFLPLYIGKTESAANTDLVAAGLVKGAVTTADNAAGATSENDGKVKTQTPAAGTVVNTGTSVALVKYAYTAP